jgi:hypothetical protein
MSTAFRCLSGGTTRSYLNSYAPVPWLATTWDIEAPFRGFQLLVPDLVQPDTLIGMAMTDLQRSHAELRAAVILAGKEIRKLNFGRADSPMLAVLRKTLRESRAARKPA